MSRVFVNAPGKKVIPDTTPRMSKKFKVRLDGTPAPDCIPCEQRRKNINAQQ